MPIYEYTCKDCGKAFEALVMGSRKPSCPGCKSQELEKLVSKCGFVSKGVGADGETTITTSASNSGCAGCSATNCGSCGIG